jgi:uncharacterized membrane protein
VTGTGIHTGTGMRGLLQRIRGADRERGTIAPLIIAFIVVIVMLLVVVTDAAQLWIYQRGLHSLADGASLQAANALDKTAIYEDGVDQTIELNRELAQQAVNDYVSVAKSDDAASSEGIECAAAINGTGTRVTVTCNGNAKLPIVGFVTNGRSEVPVQSDATAETFADD